MNWTEILIAAIGGGLINQLGQFLIAKYGKPKGEIQNLDAKTEREISEAADAIANGSKTAIETLIRTVEVYKQEADARKLERVAEKNALQNEITELKAKIQADTIDTQAIHVENVEKEKRINKLEDMVIKMSNYIDTMKLAMQKASLDVPLNGELLESARRLKLSREERERLKAGK